MSTTTPPTGSAAPKPDTATEGGGPKKPRAARKEYGYLPGATIKLTDGEKTYKGQRKERYELLQKFDGRTVDDFAVAYAKKWQDQPRGWLRFFVENEACTLSGGKAAEPKPKKEEKKAA